KTRLLWIAADRLTRRGPPEEFDAFLDQHLGTWLDDFSVFAALKRIHRLGPWWHWPLDVRQREATALRRVRRELRDDIHTVWIEQYLFDRGFSRLRDHCRERGVGLIGDLPIF